MKLETKHVVMWSGTIVVGLLGVWATLKYHAAANGAVTSTGGSLGLGAPTINIIGGSNPSTWNLAPATQPTDSSGVGASTSEVNLPVITNYNTTQNSGCNSCSSAPDAYYASAIMANSAITAAMLHSEGYTKTANGQLVAPGYYNLTGQTGAAGPANPADANVLALLT